MYFLIRNLFALKRSLSTVRGEMVLDFFYPEKAHCVGENFDSYIGANIIEIEDRFQS
jgi:hypothetical protein